MGIHAEGRKLRELSLFSGAGGGLLASQWLKGWRTVCYVEWNEYCQRVLQARIRDGFLHDAPIWDDVQTFDGRPWRGLIDVISAGFPCQPFSDAGKKQSDSDKRNMWPDTIRIVREVRPKYVFLENVRGLLSALDKSADEPIPYFGTILRDLAESGHDARWGVLSSSQFGADHKRERIWVVAYPIGTGRGRPLRDYTNRESKAYRIGSSYPLATPRDRISRIEKSLGEPGVLRDNDGLAHRVDRLTAIGNGQVPAVAANAWEMLNQ